VREACVIEAVRTPIGRLGGVLASVRPDDLAAVTLRALISRADFSPSEVEDVYLGCANQAGEDNRNVARMSLLLAGYPKEVPGATVNRLCGSGLEAVAQAARAVLSGEGHLYVAGGVESMSRAPLALAKPERAFPRGNQTLVDTALGWRFVNPKLEALGHTEALGRTAEHLAREHGIGREAQDLFALHSHERAVAARSRFAREIAAVALPDGTTVSVDEGPRADTSLAKLGLLAPAFEPGGTVTAGNSSPLNDGASALLIASSDWARAHGVTPLARIRAVGVAGVAPRVMGIGPVPATHKALARAKARLEDLVRIELNEAFAAQVLAVLGELGLAADDERVNPDGGAIALGHPLGCSGARILTTLVHGLADSGASGLGLATMCVGVGQGISMLVER
jgi:acetyl-CoA acyltransferase